MKIIKRILVISLILLASFVAGIYMLRDYYKDKIPNYDNIANGREIIKKKIYSRSGKLIKSDILPEKYTISPEQISDNIVDSYGVESNGEWHYITIAKNLFGVKNNMSDPAYIVADRLLDNSNNNIKLRVKQTILADKIRDNYSSKEILSSYLNNIQFDDNIKGLMQASYEYFNVPATQLDINQLALLRAIQNNYKTGENIEHLRKKILRDFRNKGIISSIELEDLISSPVKVKKWQVNANDKYIEQVETQLSDFVKPDDGEVSIYTPLSIKLQESAVQILKKYNGLIVVTSPDDGSILSYVDTRVHEASPPEELMNISKYLYALEAGNQPATIFKNMMMRDGFASNDSNLVSEMVDSLGMDNIANFEQAISGNKGVMKLNDILLVTARMGKAIKPQYVNNIFNNNGGLKYSMPLSKNNEQLFSEATSYQLLTMMDKDMGYLVKRTDDNKWLAAINKSSVILLHLENPNTDIEMVFKRYLGWAAGNLPKGAFAVPDGIKFVDMDALTGFAPNKNTSRIRKEVLKKWQKLPVNDSLSVDEIEQTATSSKEDEVFLKLNKGSSSGVGNFIDNLQDTVSDKEPEVNPKEPEVDESPTVAQMPDDFEQSLSEIPVIEVDEAVAEEVETISQNTEKIESQIKLDSLDSMDIMPATDRTHSILVGTGDIY